MGSWHAGGHVWEFVTLSRQGSRLALAICVDRPVVVRTGAVFASFLAAEKPSFVAVTSLLAVARIPVLLAPATHYQHSNQRADQYEGQEAAQNGAGHHTRAGRVFGRLCRGA